MGAKLVRDRMRYIPWGDEDAKKYLRPVRDENEFLSLLKAKLLEEVGELFMAIDQGDSRNVEVEIDDVMQVIAGLAALLEPRLGLDIKRMEKMSDEKAEARGLFVDGLVFDFNHEAA